MTIELAGKARAGGRARALGRRRGRELCAARGARVTVTDSRGADVLGRGAGRAAARHRVEALGGHPEAIFTGADLIVLSPGVPEIPPLRGGARGGRGDHRRDGARVALRRRDDGRDHRHQRQVDDDDARRARSSAETAARRSWAATWASRSPRRSARPRPRRAATASSRCRASSSRRSRRFARASRCCSTSPPITSIATTASKTTPRPRRASSRAAARRLRGRQRRRSAGDARVRGHRRAPDRVLDGAAAAGGRLARRARRWWCGCRAATRSSYPTRLPALDRQAQPGERARGAARGAARGRDARRGAARAARLPRAARTAWSWSPRPTACAYFDDSKGTNVGAVVAALAGFPRPVVLIAGGRDKGGDYAPLAAALGAVGPRRGADRRGGGAHRRGAVAGVAAQCGARRAWKKRSAPRPRLARPGDAVVLSPACSSFDMFRDYAHRADVFRAAVRAADRGRGRRDEHRRRGSARVRRRRAAALVDVRRRRGEAAGADAARSLAPRAARERREPFERSRPTTGRSAPARSASIACSSAPCCC